MHLIHPIYVYDEAAIDNRPHRQQFNVAFGFLINWHIILLSDSTPIPKHIEETRLIYVLTINCVFGWYN